MGEGAGGVKLGKMVFGVGEVKECKWLWGLVVVGDFLLMVFIWHLALGAVLVRPLESLARKGTAGVIPI